MVLPISNILTRNVISSSLDHRPLFNVVPTIPNASTSKYLVNNYKQFWLWFKTRPELVSTLSIPITDILGDRPIWIGIDGSELGRNKKKEAEHFWRNNRGKETIKAFLYDTLLTGDGFIWKGKPSDKEMEKAVKEAAIKFNLKNKLLDLKEISVKMSQDEDLRKLRKFDYVAASTVKIYHDNQEILGYEQTAGGQKIMFKPPEIIHYRYMAIDGLVQGFSPVESLTSEIMLLFYIKQNMISFMQNGGTPDKVFILPKETAKSQNHEFLVEQLRKYKRIENRHGNLVFTGEIDVKDMQYNPKDMEYKDLALYVTSNIAFAYGIPVTRIPFLIGASANKGDSGGLSESGYWNRISDLQDSIEDLLNSQLFEELGWHIKFERKYKQDEIREAQSASMWATTVQQYQDIFARNKKKINDIKLMRLLSFCSEDLEEMDDETYINSNNKFQNQLPNTETQFEEDKKSRNQTKKNVANSKGVGPALHNP